jgi:hypothetical protein
VDRRRDLRFSILAPDVVDRSLAAGLIVTGEMGALKLRKDLDESDNDSKP